MTLLTEKKQFISRGKHSLIDSIKSGFRSLGRKKFRSILTISGIVIGVTSVILIASIGEIGKSVVNSEIESFGAGAVAISVNNERYPEAKLAEEQLTLFREDSEIKNAVPMVMEYVDVYMRGLVSKCIVWGTDEYVKDVVAMELLYGRLITKSDVASKAQVCIVDEKLAKAYYGRSNIVGKKLKASFSTGYQEFEIIGVTRSGGDITQAVLNEYAPSFLYAPYTSLRTMTPTRNFDQVALKAEDTTKSFDEGERLVHELTLNSNEDISEAYTIENMSKYQEKLNNILEIVTIILSAIAGISVVVAGLGIMTVMLVSVNERTKEIGIKKAIGASRHNILIEFLVEAFAISLLGSTVGVILGVLITVVGCLLFGTPIAINWSTISLVVLFAITTGIVFGVYPAHLASNLSPVDALRFE